MEGRVPAWVLALAVYALWVVAGWAAKKVLFAWLRVLTSKTETKLDDVLIAAANSPITLMIFVWGAAAVIHFIPGIDPKWLRVVTLASKSLTIVAAIIFTDLLLQNLLLMYSSGIELLHASRTFTAAIIHVVVVSIGALVILDGLGFSITPIIASLGIGSLAVALALQPTFENIFSGFQILIDQPVMPGHYIRLESGEEGIVDKIGWRTSWVRQLPNNMIIIPNKQLVNARIINFNYPSKDLALPVEVGVHYNSDLDNVERIAIEVAQGIMTTVPGGIPDFKPVVRFHTFGDSSINMAVVLRAREFVDAGLLKHEFIKALTKRFAKEGIVIPYPTRAINTTQEKADNLLR